MQHTLKHNRLALFIGAALMLTAGAALAQNANQDVGKPDKKRVFAKLCG